MNDKPLGPLEQWTHDIIDGSGGLHDGRARVSDNGVCYCPKCGQFAIVKQEV